jgi:O-antigen/teichoic acid export membrane protein
MLKKLTGILKLVSEKQIFMISILIVNGGNYFYNLILGRILGPKEFADAAILITFLLVLSFLAMTFQLVTAKFSVLFKGELLNQFIAKNYRTAFFVGLTVGLLIIIFSNQLQQFFNTSTALLFIIFGFGVPVYFIMSVNRGAYQGKEHYKSLSITYKLEMFSRLIITMALLYIIEIDSSIIIAIGILISFFFGLIPFKYKNISLKNTKLIDTVKSKEIRAFFIITCFYELTQILINNSDILLVKHYFDAHQAGLYAAIAIIGRIVYFIAWMFVMLLLPTVVELKKEGKPTAPILFKYVAYIASIASAIILFCFLFPETVILILFGDSYLTVASLLWKYALATGLFAIANIFSYYFLCIDKYIPVLLTGICGMLQVLLIIFFHANLEEVILLQIKVMLVLFSLQLIYFALNSKTTTK